jgi:dTMP kinase
VLRRLNDLATDGVRPDLTILLDVPVEAGLARKAPGDVTRFEAEFDLDFHRRVRQGFLAIAAAEPDRISVVDATGDVDAVRAAIVALIDDRLLRGEPPAPHVRIKG